MQNSVQTQQLPLPATLQNFQQMLLQMDPSPYPESSMLQIQPFRFIPSQLGDMGTTYSTENASTLPDKSFRQDLSLLSIVSDTITSLLSSVYRLVNLLMEQPKETQLVYPEYGSVDYGLESSPIYSGFVAGEPQQTTKEIAAGVTSPASITSPTAIGSSYTASSSDSLSSIKRLLGIVSLLIPQFSGVGTGIKNIVGLAKDGWKLAKDIFQPVYDGIRNFFKDPAESISNGVSSVVKFVKGLF